MLFSAACAFQQYRKYNMSKKNKIIIALALAVIAFFAFRRFASKTFFDAEQDISVLSVQYIDRVGCHTDITEEVDCEYLEHILHLLKTYSGKQKITSYKLGENAYSIYLTYNDSYYFLFLYDSGYYHIYDAFDSSYRGYRIKNGDVWFNIVHGLAV